MANFEREIDIESLEKQVREFTDKILRIKQKLLLKEEEELAKPVTLQGRAEL